MIKIIEFIYFIYYEIYECVMKQHMMKQLVRYMWRQWIYSNTHPVSTISVYGLAIRTNKDTEASHCILNKRVGDPHINMYKLVNIIHEMAVDLKLTCAMSSMQKIAAYNVQVAAS